MTINDRFPWVSRIGISRSSAVRVDEESRRAVDELGDMRFMHKSLRAPGRWVGKEGWTPVEERRRFVMPALREDN